MKPANLTPGKSYTFNKNETIIYRYESINYYFFDLDVDTVIKSIPLTYSIVLNHVTELIQ